MGHHEHRHPLVREAAHHREHLPDPPLAPRMPDLYRLFGVFMRVAAALTNQAPYC